MSAARLVLCGTAGLFSGERFSIPEGGRVVVGRSRSCDISAARTAHGLRIGRDSLESNRGFLKMSRRHFEIAFHSQERIVVRDLSTNGLRVAGASARERTFTWRELEAPIPVAFGEGEILLLQTTTDDTNAKPQIAEPP